MANMIDVMSRVATNDPGAAGIIKNVIETSSITSFWQLENWPGIRHTLFREGTLPEATYRQFNAAFAGKDTKPHEPIHVEHKDFGLTYTIDPLHAEEVTRMGMNYKAQAVMEASRAMSLDLKKYYMGRGSDTNQPEGVYQWVDTWDSATNVVKIHINGGTDATLATTGISGFVSVMEQLRAQVQPDFYVTNSNIISQMLALVYSAAQNNALATYIQPMNMDVLGRPVQIYSYAGRPIFDIGQDSQNADIMDFDESDGSGSVGSSIVAIKNGNQGTVLLHKYPQMVKTTEYMQDDLEKVKLSFPHAVEVRQQRSAGRIYGILTA